MIEPNQVGYLSLCLSSLLYVFNDIDEWIGWEAVPE